MNKPSIDPAPKRSPFKRLGSYLPLVVILGFALPTLIYLAVMENLGWPVPVIGVKGSISHPAPTGHPVIIYASPNTKNFFSKSGGNYDTLLLPWRTYFLHRKRDFEEVQDVSRLRKIRNQVVILPSAVSLSDEERAEIAAFRAQGGAILSTWATGTRNGEGAWEGWQFLGSLGVRMLGEIASTADTRQLILNGESPVSHSHPSGQRIWMSKTTEPLLRFEGDMVAGRFMNWARLMDDERRREGAVVFSESAAKANTVSSRSVVFAFSETGWESHPLATYNLIDDALQWLQREPTVVRAAWPLNKRAAQVIEMDTEEGFANALAFSSMMRALDYRATFYVLTSVAKLFPDVLNQLARDFEIAYHGDVHDSFKGQPAGLQERRLLAMSRDMASALSTPRNINGFRAPTEGYDSVTERLLHKLGVRHHAADPQRTEGRLPILAKLEGVEPEDDLVVLPRTQRDDINLAAQNLTALQTTQALIDDFDLALETGALGWLSVHSQNFNPDGVLVKAMPGFLAHVNKHRAAVWLASAGQVADWWRERERFKLSSAYTGKRLVFDITITGTKPLAGASMIVMLPHKGSLPVVRATKIGMVDPVVSRIDDYRAAIVFDVLNPGNHAYQATFP